MKIKLSLIILLVSTVAFSETKKTENKQYSGVAIDETNDTLKKILALPGINDLYKKCQSAHTSDPDQIPTCIWNDPALTQGQKDQIKKIYADEQKDNTTNTSASKDGNKSVLDTGLTAKKMDVGTDYSSNPTVKALSDFYSKKMDEVLDPDQTQAKKINSVDHAKYIELYTNELSKTIVNSFTSYCLETPASCRKMGPDPDDPTKLAGTGGKCLIPKDATARKTNATDNINALSSATFSNTEGAGWGKCITDVTQVCYKTNATTDDEKYSKQRACVIMDFVKAARKDLIAANEQKEFYKDLANKSAQSRGLASIVSNVNVIDDRNTQSTADKLTELTSSDIQKDFKNTEGKTENIAKVVDQPKKEMDDCLNNGQVSDQEKCKKFLSTDTDKNTAAVTEFGLSQLAEGDNLNKKLEEDKNVAAYLKEEGYSDKEIQTMTSAENIASVKDQIKKRYASEKDALIKEMSERVNGKTSTTQGKVDSQDATKLGQIQTELRTRNSDLQNLIHFNNIVSSYLTIEDKNKQTSRNTASLMAEVNTYTGTGADDLKKNIKGNNDLKKDSNTNADLSVDTLNKLIKYDLNTPSN